VTRPEPGRTLRSRLALLYAGLFLGTGVLLLVIAGLPLVRLGRTVRVPATGAPASAAGPAQSGVSLPQALPYAAVALAVLVAASAGLGWLVADRALRPLRDMTAAARAISAASLGERLSLDGSYEEFRELGGTLDGLLARLEAAFGSQRHFVANASHELRTPLAAERTVLQVALADPDASAASLRLACEQALLLGAQQERLIEALLTLATSQRGLQHREPFDLAEITRSAVQARSAEAGRRGVLMDARLGPAAVTGDPSLAGSLVANLVDNAIRHNVAGGRIEIATAMTAGPPRLRISNTGAVIAPGEVDRLFQPFQQLGAERTRRDGGHGLGLAIVAAIARAHGAAVAARPRPGGGLDITVSFRPAPPA
jgi:signal transduction histidine kinase